MTKTDWTAEHSVEEVLEMASVLLHNPKPREWKTRAGNMLTAFAERIEADERVVPVGEVRTDGCMHFAYIPMSIPDGTKVFTHPPAQPAQEQPGWKVPDGWADAYAAFKGAFDTPAAWLKDSSEYANDARKRLCEFNDAMLAASPTPPKEN